MYGEDEEYTYSPPAVKTAAPVVAEDDEYTYVAPKPKSAFQKLKDYGEARAKRSLGQALKEDVGNIPLMPVSVGYLAQKARNLFGGKPTTFENTQANPTIGGIVHGLGNIPIGAGQMAALLGEELGIPGSEESAAGMRQAAKEWDSTFKDPSLDPSKSGVMLGESIPYLLTGGGAAATEAKQLPRFLQQAKLAAQRATAGGIINAIQPDTESLTDEEYARRAWERAKVGGAMGAAIPPVASALGKGTGYVADKLAGTRFGNIRNPLTGKQLIPTEVKPEFAGAPEEMRAMQAKGLRPTVGDVTGDKVIMGQEAHDTARNPLLIANRAKGSTASLNDAEQAVMDQYGKVRASNWEGLKELEAAAKNPLHERNKEAKRTLDLIKNAGVDAGDTEQASAMGRLFKQQTIGDKYYAKADAIARPLGDVPAPEVEANLAEGIDKLQSIKGSDKQIINLMKEVHEGILNADRVKNPPVNTPARNIPAETDAYGTVTKPSTTIPASSVGEEATGIPQDMTYPGLRKLKTRLNSVIADGVEGSVAPKGEELNYLKRTVKDIDRAMAEFEDASPELKEAASVASSHHKANVVPYQEAKFGRALASPDSAKSEAVLLQGKNADEKERYFELLGKKGQEAAKARLLQTAIGKGAVPRQGAAPPSLTTRKAADALDALENDGTLDVMFKGADRKAIEGLKRTLRTVQQQEGIQYSPEQSIPEGIYPTRAGAVHGVLARTWHHLSEKRLYDLYTNPESKLFFQRLASQKAGSPGFIDALNNFAKTANDKGQLP